ncbi:MAG: hypothetical protein KGJ86_16225, partial [Chloroflexota bacterium]|nr:hypothetical protein [Chloroflexota bacterium]
PGDGAAGIVAFKPGLDEEGRPIVALRGGAVLPLRNLLELARGCSRLFLDLEGHEEARAVSELLARGAGDGTDVTIASFALGVLKMVARAAPGVSRCVKFAPGSNLPGMLVACRYTGASYAHVCFRPLDKLAVTGLRRARVQVISPIATSLEEARQLIPLGIDVLAGASLELLATALATQMSFGV